MYKGTFLEYLVDRMDISTVKEHYAEFSNGGDFIAYVKELAASRDSRILSAVPSEEIKQLNCRWTKLQEIAKKIGKENIINIQRMYPDDDIYFIYYFERGIAG